MIEMPSGGTGMFRKLVIALLFAALPFAAACAADSASKPATGSSLHLSPYFRSLGLADGMPSSEIAKIAQDHDGFIWIGTHDGLVRYDGVAVRVYRHDDADPKSISADDVGIVFVDKDNRIWCGGENSGLNVLDATRTGFTHFVHDANDPGSLAAQDVWSIGQDAEEVSREMAEERAREGRVVALVGERARVAQVREVEVLVAQRHRRFTIVTRVPSTCTS